MAVSRHPKVGDKVYYKSYGTPKGEFKPDNRVAFITEVTNENVVSLAVLNPTGMFFNRYVNFGDKGGQWSWID